MPKPVPGSTYVVVKGDTMWDIAKAAFGNPWKFKDIFEANKSTLRSGDPWWIYPGEILIIPPFTPLEEEAATVADDSEELPGADPDGVQLIINGTQIDVKTFSIFRGIDKGAAGWNATTYWDPKDLDLSILYQPYSYFDSKVYVGGILLDTGRIYVQNPKSATDGVIMNLAGYTYTKDIVDSTVDPPYQRNNFTLNQVANEYCVPRGITVVDNTPALGTFKRITADKTEKIFDFLAKLAKQKGALINSTPKGYLRITKAEEQVENLGTIGDNLAFGDNFEIKFDGTKRYRNYRVLGKRRGKRTSSSLVNDQVVPKSRSWTIEAGDIINEAELRTLAEWERGKGLADSLTLNIEVSSWYSPTGALWRENKHVTVKSERLFISDGFTFLIKSVNFKFDGDGRKCVLSLVPPTAFTGEDLEEPWL
jgi:prophage tail gpP-like protein